MAASFRSAGTWSFTATNVASPSTLTPGAPAGTAVGDCLVLWCESISNTATVATPSGWALVPGFPKRSGTASGGTIYAFVRKADGSGSDTPSPVWSGLTTGTSGDSSGAGIECYIGLSVNLDGAVQVTDDAADTTTTTIPAVTTFFPGSMALGAAMKVLESAGQTSTVATFTERADNATASGNGHTIETSDHLNTSPGSSGTAAVTWSATTSARALAVSFALQDATTPPPRNPVAQPMAQAMNAIGWQLAWAAQKGATIAALTLSYGQQPPRQVHQQADIKSEYVQAWEQKWVAQRGAQIVPFTLSYGDQPPRQGPLVGSEDVANTTAINSWSPSWGAQQGSWPAQRGAAIAPLVSGPSGWIHTGGGGDTSSLSGSLDAQRQVTCSAAVSVGDLICVSISWSTSNASGAVVTDNLGNTYTQVITAVDVGNNEQGELWSSIATHAGTPVVTLQFNPVPGATATGFSTLLVDTFTNSNASSVVDGTGSGNQQGSPTTVANATVSGTWPTANDGDLIYSATHDVAQGNDPGSVGSGFTLGQVQGSGTFPTGTTWARSSYATQRARSPLTQASWTAALDESHLTLAMAITPASPPATWTNGQDFKINHTKLSADLTNFVFPLYIPPNTIPGLKSILNGGQVASGAGYDITVTDQSAIVLWKLVLRKYDPTTGEYLAWVQAPFLSHTVDTHFRLLWGNASITADQSTSATFDSTIFQRAAFLDNVASSLDLTDYSGLAALTNSGATATTGITVGGAAHETHASVQFIDGGSPSQPATNDHAWSIWVNADSFAVAYNAVVSAVTGGGTNFGQLFVKSTGKLAVFYGQNIASTFYDGSGLTTLSTGTWYRLASARTSSGAAPHARGYVNGVQDSTGDDTGSTNGFTLSVAADALLGSDGNTAGREWDGKLAIFFEYKDARSDDWFFAEYNSQVDPTSFAMPVVAQGPSAQGSAALLAANAQAWIASWGAQRAPSLVTLIPPFGNQPPPTPPLVELLAKNAEAWQVSWSAQRPATVAPLTLTYGDRPQLPAASPDLLARNAKSWITDWPGQRGASIVPLTLARGDQVPPPVSPSVLAQNVQAWAVAWSAQRPPTIVPLTLTYGDQPVPQAPLGSAALETALSTWQPAPWTAQSEPDNASWNVPASVQPVPADPQLLARLAASWVVTWGAQSAEPVSPLTIPSGDQVPPLPLGPGKLQQIVQAWAVSWGAQGPPTVVPLTLIGGDRPQLGPASPTLLAQINAQWAVSWSAQSSAPNAAWNVPPIVAVVPPPVSPSFLAQNVAAWQVTWGAQRGATVAPLTLTYGAQVPPPVSPALLAQNAQSWIATWSAQRPAQIAPLTLAYGDRPPAPVSPALLAANVAAWTTTWSAQSEADNAGWNFPPIVTQVPPGVSASFLAQIVAAWQVAWPAQRPAQIVPLTLVQGTRPQVPALSPQLLAQNAASWAVSWTAQHPAPVAPLTLRYGSQPTPIAPVSAATLNVIAGWQVSWTAQRPPTIVPLTLTYGVQPRPQPPLSMSVLATVNATWQASWGSQHAGPVAQLPRLPTPVLPPLVTPQLLAQNVAAWQPSWGAQSARPVAALIPPYTGVPVSPQLLEQINRSWMIEWSAQPAHAHILTVVIPRIRGQHQPVASIACAPGFGGNPIASLTGAPLRGGNPIAVACQPIRPSPRPPTPPPALSDAIISPEIEFVDSFDLGIMQSVGGASDADRLVEFPQFAWYRWQGSDPNAGATGTFLWHATGGRENGGWLEAVSNRPALRVSLFYPLYNFAIQDEAGPVTYEWAGFFVGLNQRGVVPDGSTGMFGSGLLNAPVSNTNHGYARFIIRPDYGIDLIQTDRGGGPTFFDHLIYSSPPGIVPVTGWYGIEVQQGLNPANFNKGGFALLRIYRESDAPEGVSVVHQVGVKTGATITSGGPTTYTTKFTAIPVYLQPGTGIDDFAYYQPTGAHRRWLTDTYIEGCQPAAVAAAPGSIVAVTHNVAAGTPPQSYGGTFRFGDDDRSRNVTAATSDQRGAAEADTSSDYNVGHISSLTNAWLDGPTLPVPADPIISNKVYGSAEDVFMVAPARARVSIEGIGLAIRAGRVVKTVTVRHGGILGIGFAGPGYNMHGTEEAADPGVAHPWFPFPTTNYQATVRPGLISNGVRVSPYPFHANDSPIEALVGFSGIGGFWPPLSHIVKVDPATGVLWTPDAALAHSVFYKGDPTVDIPLAMQDPAPSPEVRYIAADVVQLASEIIYHKDIVTQEFPLFVPQMDVTVVPPSVGGNVCFVSHHCVDFNDGPSHIVDHITLVTIDWGDGHTDTFPAPGVQLNHTYARGNFLITVTATNAHGLTNFYTQTVQSSNQSPVASFTRAVNPSDLSNMTIDFTDTSTDPDGNLTIVGHLWDFDALGAPGVHTSTAKNPTFNFTALGPGTYRVMETVTDDLGLTDSFFLNVTVPFGVGVSFDFDEQFPDVDAAAFIARIVGDTDYDALESTHPNTSTIVMDATVQYHGHQTLKVLTGTGWAGSNRFIDLWHRASNMTNWWLGWSMRVPANYMAGNLLNALITNPTSFCIPVQFFCNNTDQFQYMNPSIQINGAGGDPPVYAGEEFFYDEGASFDEFCYNPGNATSGRTVSSSFAHFADFATGNFIRFATFCQQFTGPQKVRMRTYVSIDDGATWTLFNDQTVLAANMNGEPNMTLHWIEFSVHHTAPENAGDAVWLGEVQLADADIPGNNDPFNVHPGP